ncbi:hypothetical protein BIV23_26820 [Streptomyces monashensis]|uniref:Tyr recombinase domain-containing protein n=1 Tax=Streptomyces monashensis TaxID=1678012 RepID=A0A1S2Q4I5_9ACTN|nr:hypothetical protein BIV23_26820 [Streptomyces monashensis]
MDRAGDAEVLALPRACRTARDRPVVLLMTRVGLRRGETVGPRREGIHFVVGARHLGCSLAGSHRHVGRRDNGTGAWAKSRRSRSVPADFLVVQWVVHPHAPRRAFATNVVEAGAAIDEVQQLAMRR